MGWAGRGGLESAPPLTALVQRAAMHDRPQPATSARLPVSKARNVYAARILQGAPGIARSLAPSLAHRQLPAVLPLRRQLLLALARHLQRAPTIGPPCEIHNRYAVVPSHREGRASGVSTQRAEL